MVEKEEKEKENKIMEENTINGVLFMLHRPASSRGNDPAIVLYTHIHTHISEYTSVHQLMICK